MRDGLACERLASYPGQINGLGTRLVRDGLACERWAGL